MYYSSIGILALLVHLIINSEHMRPIHEGPTVLTEKRYRQYLASILLYYVTDISWGLLYENDLILLCYIDTILYFIAVALSVFLWTRFVVIYLDHENTYSKLMISGGIGVLGFQIGVLILNIFVPIAFSFNENTDYVAGQARYIALIAQIILNLITIGYTLVIANKTTGKTKLHHRTIGISGFVMTGFIVLQMFFPLMPFYSIGCLLATCIIHSFVYRDKMIEHASEMATTKIMAHKDALTGVRNKLAYIETLRDLESRADEGKISNYGIVVFDVNDLKLTNDTLGHDAGDKLLKEACSLICKSFDHCPVFRVGGDEFVAILMGDSYNESDELIRNFEEIIDGNLKTGNVVIASGYDIYRPDAEETYNDVFKRADTKMYARKEQLKKDKPSK